MIFNNEEMAGLTGNSNSSTNAQTAIPEETSEAETSDSETSFEAGETTASSSFEGGETPTEGATTITTELQYFGSDHAVDGRHHNHNYIGGLDAAQKQAPAENRRLESLTIGRVVARRRQSRKSINLGDLITNATPANRRESINSMMSSLTMTDYGDSFFTDEDSRWFLDDLLEEDHDDNDVGDSEPILPIRRDSLHEERLISSRHHAFYDLGMPPQHTHDDNDAACPSCHPSKVGHDLPPKTARPPMKPGRRESVASIQQLRQTMFPERNSITKDKPIMPPNRNESVSSTLCGHFSLGFDREQSSGHFSTGEETTGSSSIDPSLDLGLKRTKGKKALFT